MVSYSPSIVTIAVSCIISETRDILVESGIRRIRSAFDAPVSGVPSEYCHTVWYAKKLEWRAWLYQRLKKFKDMCNHGITVSTEYRRDGQTSCDGIVRAMH